jgi:chromosome segregation ATPase
MIKLSVTMGAKTTRLGDEVAELKRASKHGEFEVQRLERRVRQLEGRFGELEGRFGELEGRVRELEDEIAALKARIGPVEEDVDKLARVATSHRGTLQYLRGQLRKLGNRQHAS